MVYHNQRRYKDQTLEEDKTLVDLKHM